MNLEKKDADIAGAFSHIERSLKQLNDSLTTLTEAACGDPKKGVVGVFTKVLLLWQWGRFILVGIISLIITVLGFLTVFAFNLAMAGII